MREDKRNLKYFFYVIPILLIFGCIQITPTQQKGEKIGIEFTGPSTVKIGGTSSFSLRVFNNLSKPLSNLRAYVYSPDAPVSLSQKLISLGDLDAGGEIEENSSFALGSNAIKDITYSIEGRICFDYQQIGSRSLAFSKEAIFYNFTEEIEDGPLSISFSDVPNIIFLAPAMQIKAKLKNDLNGDVTTESIESTPNSAIKRIEVSLQKADWMSNVVAKVAWVEKDLSNAMRSDSSVTWSFDTNDIGSLTMQMRNKEKEVFVIIYADLDKAYSELENTDALLSEIKIKLTYTYCIDLSTYSFKAISY